jgi:hypothetical protein
MISIPFRWKLSDKNADPCLLFKRGQDQERFFHFVDTHIRHFCAARLSPFPIPMMLGSDSPNFFQLNKMDFYSNINPIWETLEEKS